MTDIEQARAVRATWRALAAAEAHFSDLEVRALTLRRQADQAERNVRQQHATVIEMQRLHEAAMLAWREASNRDA